MMSGDGSDKVFIEYVQRSIRVVESRETPNLLATSSEQTSWNSGGQQGGGSCASSLWA